MDKKHDLTERQGHNRSLRRVSLISFAASYKGMTLAAKKPSDRVTTETCHIKGEE